LYRLASIGLFLWAALWWLGTGFVEILDRLPGRFSDANGLVIFLALSFGGAALIARARRWSGMLNLSYVFLPLLILPALYVLFTEPRLLQDLGWLAWPLALAVQVFVLKLLDAEDSPGAGIWHFATLVLTTMLLAIEAYLWTERAFSDEWGVLVAVIVTGIMALLTWRFRQQPSWPVPVHPVVYLNASILLVAALTLGLTALSLAGPGNPDPLPYIPVLNPYDLAMLFAMLVAGLSLGAIRRESGLSGDVAAVSLLAPYKLILAAAFFLMTTIALVRGVHHYTGVSWDDHALYNSVIVQTSLSIYWGLLGFIGMIWGARSTRRPVWLAGAGFMALVVIKLFLVDLGNTGTVERIVSYMGIGALLLVVGYFAPAPPRNPQDAEHGKETGQNES
jgi:uncharacterized membrane protein